MLHNQMKISLFFTRILKCLLLTLIRWQNLGLDCVTVVSFIRCQQNTKMAAQLLLGLCSNDNGEMEGNMNNEIL